MSKEELDKSIIKVHDPDLEGLIDEDILKRFENSNVFWGDIINAQLIKTNKELIEEIRNRSKTKV